MDMMTIQGRRLYFREEGAGPAVLILHGTYLIHADSWDATIAVLVERGYRVVYPHRAGRQESDPHPVFLSLARDAADCWALLDHLGIQQAALIGHSQGAYVAREMYLTRPGAVKAIVTEDSGALGKLGPAVVANASVDRFDAEMRRMYEKWRHTLTFLGRPWDYPSDYNVSRCLEARRRRRLDDEWKYQQVPDPCDAPVPEGKYCDVPALVFTAGRGRIRQDDPEVEELRERIPATDMRLVVVTESGHGIHEEQFDVFSRHLLQFLGQVHGSR